MKEGKTEKIVGINHQTFRQKMAHADRILRFTILSSARWTCPNDRLPYPIPKTSIG